jgi:hypothetical protein
MTGASDESNRAGVCVVRVECQSDRLLITVSSTPDIANGYTGRRVFRDPNAALAVVSEFLRLFSD